MGQPNADQPSVNLDFVVKRLQARPRKGETQKERWKQIAKATGVPFNTLKKIASGETTDPRISTFAPLASYFLAS